MTPANTKARATIDAARARRLLLGAQGLMNDPSRRADRGTVRRLIEQMGFVQIDTINVVERAHHLTLHSRLDGYRPALLTRLLESDRRLFEHWTHDASAIPIDFYPHWKHRFERYRQKATVNAWWKKRIGEDGHRVIEHVRDRVEREGPLMSRDFNHDRNGEAGTWWSWKPQKAALEHLWRAGELAIARRVNFQKVYDLAQRVHPEQARAHMPDRVTHIDWACRAALDRLMVATATEIASFWNFISSAEARQWCEQAANRGEIERVTVNTADGTPPIAAYAVIDWRQQATRFGAAPDRMRLLCPFDPVLRDRQRAARLFKFDYRFEAFVPAARRRFGYYVMPILDRDRLVGRVDPKFHRDRGELEIARVWWEPGETATPTRLARLEAASERLAGMIGADRVRIGR